MSLFTEQIITPEAYALLKQQHDELLVVFAKLQRACGYVEDGSSQSVTISQDDATGSWVLTAGRRSYYADSFSGLFQELSLAD